MEPLLKKYKVLIIGNSCVGKTSILKRHVDGKFSEEVAGTIGVDYRANTYIRDGHRYDMQIWDTAGQERFRNVTRAYYRDANAALLVFDLGNVKSFNAIADWYHQLLEQTNKQQGDMVVVLIGNKCDVKPEVKLNDIQDLAAKLGISTYVQTSAKNGDRINEVFDQLLEKLISKDNPGIQGHDNTIRVGQRVRTWSRSKDGQGCC